MIIKICYINFWKDENNDRYFSKFIQHNFNYKVIEVKPNQNPDILISSCRGGDFNSIKNINAHIKIFYYGENLNRFPPYNNQEKLIQVFDLIIGFNNTDLSMKKLYFPLWLIYYKYYSFESNDNLLKYIETKYLQNKNKNKTYLSTLVCRHDRQGQRTKICNVIQKYGNIYYGGDFRNNVGKIGNTIEDKVNFISQSYFNICPENSKFQGYVTEKIFQAFEGGTIPIYWGEKLPEKNIINKDKYIFCNLENQLILNQQIKHAVENKDKFLNGPLFCNTAKDELTKIYNQLKQCLKILFTKIPK